MEQWSLSRMSGEYPQMANYILPNADGNAISLLQAANRESYTLSILIKFITVQSLLIMFLNPIL